MRRLMKPREIVLVSMCGALYASVGILTFLGIFAPVFGVVRFWPAVVVPGLFALAFGPAVGGLGAAIGIFVSDLVIHGDALLSITVGVPSNLVGFYVLGLIAGKHQLAGNKLKLLSAAAWVTSTLAFLYFYLVLMSQPADMLGILICSGASVMMLFPLAWGFLRNKDLALRYALASAVGLGLGSAYIGIGIWAYSHIFALPSGVMGGEPNLPIFAAILLAFWTYSTEIPFLVGVVPPLYEAVRRALPSLGGSQG